MTGDRTVVSGCLDEPCSPVVGTGKDFESPLGIAVEADGAILVTELDSFFGSEFRALFRVNPSNGNRTVLSRCEQFECTSVAGAGMNFSIPLGACPRREGLRLRHGLRNGHNLPCESGQRRPCGLLRMRGSRLLVERGERPFIRFAIRNRGRPGARPGALDARESRSPWAARAPPEVVGAVSHSRGDAPESLQFL